MTDVVHASVLPSADDAHRQSLYETLVGLATFTAIGYESGVSNEDPELVEAFQSIAASFLEAVLGTGIDRISFDASGLVIH